MKIEAPRTRVLLRVAITLVGLVWMANSAAAEPGLRFVADSGESHALSRSQLREACNEEQIEVADPYHKRAIRYVAIPLHCVLDLGFASTTGAEGLRTKGLLLRALDGYTRPVKGTDLLEAGGFVAFGEPDRLTYPVSTSWFSKIDRGGVDPGPFYLVWTGPKQNDPHEHPWPYQLSTIQVAPFAEAFPRTVPSGLDPEDPGWAGYALFERSCASCHSVNGEGGKVGPDLNVPRSIVEYRPIAQIRDYIRNPEQTRYTNMPAHPDLSEADLDALIAYFLAMSHRKDDPHLRGES